MKVKKEKKIFVQKNLSFFLGFSSRFSKTTSAFATYSSVNHSYKSDYRWKHCRIQLRSREFSIGMEVGRRVEYSFSNVVDAVDGELALARRGAGHGLHISSPVSLVRRPTLLSTVFSSPNLHSTFSVLSTRSLITRSTLVSSIIENTRQGLDAKLINSLFSCNTPYVFICRNV